MKGLILIKIVIISVGLLGFLLMESPIFPNGLLIPSGKSKEQLADPNPVYFKDVSLALNVNAVHQQRSESLNALTESLGTGVCVFDANNDGYVDIFHLGGSGHLRHYGKKAWWHKESGNQLLINNQGLYFNNEIKSSGMKSNHWGMGCAARDFDNDGLVDLLITGKDKNLLYKNIGNGQFENITEESGIKSAQWSTSASLADFNQDGLIDIYINNYIVFKKGMNIYEKNTGFDITQNSSFIPSLYDPEPNSLYINQGNMKFVDVTTKYKVANAQGRSLVSKWIDINQDSWLDLLVINDQGSVNQVYINQKGKAFIPVQEGYELFNLVGSRDLVKIDLEETSAYFMSRKRGLSPLLLTESNNDPEQISFVDVAEEL